MELEVIFRNHEAGELIVKKGTKVLERFPFKVNRNLETMLIQGIDKILEKNKMDLLSLKKMKVGGEISPDSLSYQLAETFIKALNS